ncbi:MAG: RIP metalloprotease RseP [Pseudomonadales bacterium]|jgi:regulator of sigma E protease
MSVPDVFDILLYPLALLVTLGVLVTVHEFGHFIIARRSGVRVVRFSVGFGRPLLRFEDRLGTEFVLAAIPLGGYVRMLDEREPGVIETERRAGDVSYLDLSVGWRMAIAAGGPFANFVLAFVVYWVLLVLGTTTLAPVIGTVGAQSALERAGGHAGLEIVAVDNTETRSWQEVSMALAARLGDTGVVMLELAEPGADQGQHFPVPISAWHRGEDEPDLIASLGIEPGLLPIVGEVVADAPAAAAGLQPLDRIVAVDDAPIETWQQWVEQVQAAPERPLLLTVRRDGVDQRIALTPGVRPGMDAAAADSGYAGVGPYVREIVYGPLGALPRALTETWNKTVLTVHLLGKMVVGDVSMSNLSGPITIARVAGDSARSGIPYFLGVLALLSISLGVLNLLPIPILDGGHIVFCAAEALRGRPLSERAQALGMQIGLFMVGGLMVIALYNDVARLF